MRKRELSVQANIDRPVARQVGQALVEIALILPVLVLILMGVFDFGRAFYAYNAISNGAREGARYGIIHPTATDPSPPYDDPDTIEGRAVAQTFILDIDELNITVETPQGTERGNPLTVTMQYDLHALTPLISVIWGGGALSLESSANMYIE